MNIHNLETIHIKQNAQIFDNCAQLLMVRFCRVLLPRIIAAVFSTANLFI